VSVDQLNQLQLSPQQAARGAIMENMKSIIFDHWGHRGQPLEAKVSKTESIIDDLNFHVFKSAAPQLPQKLLQSDHGKHEINHFRSLGTPWTTSRSKSEQD